MRKMSAFICTMLALAMAVGLFVLRMPMSYAETFSQMKDSIPKTVTFTIDGKAVEIPVILPDVEEVPIGYLCPGQIDAKEMKKIFGEQLHQNSGDGHLRIESGKLNSGAPAGTKRTWLDTDIAPGIDLTPEAAEAKFFELVEKSGLDLTFMPEKMLVKSGFCYVDEIEVDISQYEEEMKEAGIPMEEFENYTKRVVNLEKPAEGFEAGYYVLVATQTANGVPIYPVKSPNGMSWFGPYVDMGIASETVYSLGMAYVSQPCGAGKEPQLVPFETVVQNIQRRIDEGWLRNVDSIRLSYGQTNLVRNGQKTASKYADPEHPNGALVPVWKVDGYDRTQLQRTMQYDFAPSAFDRYTQLLPNGFYLSYDATTGELWSRESWEE